MKRIIPVIGISLLLGISFKAVGQNKIESTGNVGIGTTSPGVPLHVIGDARFERDWGGSNYLLINADAGGVYLTSDDPGTNQKDLFFRVSPTGNNGINRHIRFQAGKNEGGAFLTRMIVRGDGKVGIGTITPKGKFEISHDQTIGGKWNPSSSAFSITQGSQSLLMDPNELYSSLTLNIGSYSGDIVKFLEVNDAGNNVLMTLKRNGNLGIGTTTPDSKLSVNGNIRAREIKLETDNWPDYVFEEGYLQMGLEEVEAFIAKHGHLPGLKSAEEYERDGVHMMELNQQLLEKIEELTLYTISQEESLKRKEGEIAEMKKRLDKIEKLMDLGRDE